MTRENIEKHMHNTYGCSPEYPWINAPTYAVYRHFENRKWFAVVMDIPKRRLGIESDDMATIMNIKCDPILIGSLLMDDGFFPAYHMNKTYWITVILDGSVDDERIKWLIDMSYDLTKKKTKNRTRFNEDERI